MWQRSAKLLVLGLMMVPSQVTHGRPRERSVGSVRRPQKRSERPEASEEHDDDVALVRLDLGAQRDESRQCLLSQHVQARLGSATSSSTGNGWQREVRFLSSNGDMGRRARSLCRNLGRNLGRMAGHVWRRGAASSRPSRAASLAILAITRFQYRACA